MKQVRKLNRYQYQMKLRTRKKKTRLRPWAFWTLLLFFSILLIFSFLILYSWHRDNKSIEDIEQELDDIVEVTTTEGQGELINPPEDKNNDYWYYITLPFYEVDFKELLKKNPDTVAFIHIPNTNINYPIVQSNDNSYYLTHAFDKSKNDAGWVFMDYRNQNNFVDDNTIIYGHGRVNKTVFGSLKTLLTKTWQSDKSNYVIQISTPNANYVYQIFSIYTIDAESYYIIPSFATSQSKQTWISTMQERNQAMQSADVSVYDKIITLSTCQNNNGGRIVVQGKLIKQQAK